MTKALISRLFPYHSLCRKLSTYYLTAFDKQVQELNLIQAEEEQEPEYSWPAMGGIA